MLYGAYKNARNAAWSCLLDYKINKLPVDVFQIAREAGITIIKNSLVRDLSPHESGCAYYVHKQWYIIYDDTNSVERIRFTIAHELGHIFLGHRLRRGRSTGTKEFEPKPLTEREADVFASRLLCPACVIYGLNLHTCEEISQVCHVSLTAARIRSERMELLYERNKFLTSSVEREVYKNFENFILTHNAERDAERKNNALLSRTH